MPLDLGQTSGSSDFLFVACNGRNGRPSKNSRRLVNSHLTLRQAVVASRSDTTATINSPWSIHLDRDPQTAPQTSTGGNADVELSLSCPDDLRRATSENFRRHARKQQQGLETAKSAQRRRLETVTAKLLTSNILLHDTAFEKVCKYYFYSQDDPRSASYTVARQQWAEKGWDIGRKSIIFHHGLVLYAYRKQFELEGRQTNYLLQTGRVVKLLQKQTQARILEPMALVAVGILAYCALLDGDLASARVHLETLRKLDAETTFQNLNQEWLYVVWVDLRYSLITRSSPLLNHCIPSAYQYQTITTSKDHDRVEANVQLCIGTEAITKTELNGLFVQTYRLASLWEAPTDIEEPPYGLIYDLEYSLRVLDAKARAISDMSAELTLMAIQLNVWIISRFWAPASSNSRRYLLSRGCNLARDQDTFEGCEKEWILWVYTILCACSLEVGFKREDTPLQQLLLLVESQGISTLEDFVAKLSVWPYIADWHGVKLEMLWRELMIACGRINLEQRPSWTRTSHFYVGPVEFYGD